MGWDGSSDADCEIILGTTGDARLDEVELAAAR